MTLRPIRLKWKKKNLVKGEKLDSEDFLNVKYPPAIYLPITN